MVDSFKNYFKFLLISKIPFSKEKKNVLGSIPLNAMSQYSLLEYVAL